MESIKTKRLILRPFMMSDLNDFYEYAKVPGVGEKAGWPHHTSIEESKVILEMFIKKQETFAIVLKDANKVIGSVGLHERAFDEFDNQFKQRELGYVLSKDYWGQGLMSEAVKAVIDYAFVTLKLDRLTVSHFVENAPSKRVIEKAGFTFVKQGKYYASQLKKEFDDLQYVMLKEDYLH